jgi:hypothetical protein
MSVNGCRSRSGSAEVEHQISYQGACDGFRPPQEYDR